jgi:2,4-dienoyl-CoA reductase-like NADH-dependent reductase (Old Yellow Enzyme family)
MEPRMKLFNSISVGPVMLKNRIVFPAFENNTFTEEGFVTQATLDFYYRIASGGAGLVITGATNVNPDPKMRHDRYLGDLSHDKFIRGHQKLAEAIHRGGSKGLVQLVDKTAVAISKGPADFSVEEIKQIINFFVQGARRAKEAGFDGVDYHFAHIYTVHQFLSRASNKRGDEWGGGCEGRAKLAVEIIRATREEVGSDFILSPRFSGDEFRLWGNTLEDTRPIAQMFVKSGADMLDISAGGQPYAIRGVDRSKNQYVYPDGMGAFLGRTHPGPEYPDGANVHLAEGIRKAINAVVPVMTAGKIRTPVLAEEILQENKADLIAIGRGLLIDPEFPKKTEEGRWNEIIQCTCCNLCHRALKREEITTCGVLNKMEESGSQEAKRLNQALKNANRLRVV